MSATTDLRQPFTLVDGGTKLARLKRCPGPCGLWKPRTDYQLRQSSSDNCQTYCAECQNARMRSQDRSYDPVRTKAYRQTVRGIKTSQLDERSVETYLMSRIGDPEGPHGCMPWLGRLDRDGYARWSHKTYSRLAHRDLMGLYLRRDLLPEECVDHHCRQTDCVNVEHLSIVTAEENSRRVNLTAEEHWALPRSTAINIEENSMTTTHELIAEALNNYESGENLPEQTPTKPGTIYNRKGEDGYWTLPEETDGWAAIEHAYEYLCEADGAPLELTDEECRYVLYRLSSEGDGLVAPTFKAARVVREYEAKI